MSSYTGEPEQFDEPVLYTCRRGCGRQLKSLEHDGECATDCGTVEIDHTRRREAQRRLQRYTARLLREQGYHEDAANLELDAEGRW